MFISLLGLLVRIFVYLYALDLNSYMQNSTVKRILSTAFPQWFLGQSPLFLRKFFFLLLVFTLRCGSFIPKQVMQVKMTLFIRFFLKSY